MERISYGESDVVPFVYTSKKAQAAAKKRHDEAEGQAQKKDLDFFAILDNKTHSDTLGKAFGKKLDKRPTTRKTSTGHGHMMLNKLKKAAFYVKAVEHEKRYNRQHAQEKR